MPDSPNLLFILADQLRAASLPSHGESQIETPNLDRLAAEGVLFRNAISTCPVSRPIARCCSPGGTRRRRDTL